MVSSRGIKNQSKVDLFRASAQADESFHGTMGKYSDKHLNFRTSTEARFALGECSKKLRDLESRPQRRKERKGNKSPKEERKTRPEMNRK
jgi:hypothetical protein